MTKKLRSLLHMALVFAFWLTVITVAEKFVHPWILWPSSLLTGFFVLSRAIARHGSDDDER